jgi:cell division protein ZapA
MSADAAREGRATTRVNVSINERQFRLACEEGQEPHLRQLAKDLDDRINALRSRFGEIGDARLIVMAALMEADELLEANKKIQQLEEELAALRAERAAAAEREQEAQITVSAAFHAAAERIEGLTTKLNQAAGGGSSFEKF